MEGCLRDDKGCAYSPNLSATAARPAGIPSSMSLSADGIKVLGSPLKTPSILSTKYQRGTYPSKMQAVRCDGRLFAQLIQGPSF